MEEITLQALLEAGCHFGHKSERWNPKASSFIYTEKDGVHIIDLAQTKLGLEKAVTFTRGLVAGGGDVLFVGTKRQAAGSVKEQSDRVGAPYLVERWIGGFLTNWDSVKKNIEKINRLADEQKLGAWKKFPKHEQSKLTRYLGRLRVFYGGVLTFKDLPSALFVVDVKKEQAAVREAVRRGIPIIAIVDTNSDPSGIDYVIPANDDAVGSIKYIVHCIAEAYKEGKEKREKEAVAAREKESKKEEENKKSELESPQPKEMDITSVKPVDIPAKHATKGKPDSVKATTGKRGRPRKSEK